jgi:trehalose transport system substrate-binding protein
VRERIFPPFEQQHGVAIRSIQAEAADAVKKLVAMHRAGRIQVDLMTQDVLLLQPLVDAGTMEDLSAYQCEIPNCAAAIGGCRYVQRRHLFHALSPERPDRLLS